MSRIGPDGPAPDMQALIRALRQAVDGLADAPAPVGRGRVDPLTRLFAGDGPAPGVRQTLPALRRLLLDSLATAGGAGELARRLIARLDTGPGAGAQGPPPAGPGGTVLGGPRGTGPPGPSATGPPGAASVGGPRSPAVPGAGPGVPGSPGGAAPGGPPGSGPGAPPTARPPAGPTAPGVPAPGVPAPGVPAPGVPAPGVPASAVPAPGLPAPGTAPPVPGPAGGPPTGPAPAGGAPPPAAPAPPLDLIRALLPASPAAQARTLAGALVWLADHLDQAQAVTAGCAQLGPAAAALGVPPERLEQLSLLLADALRAGAAPMPAEQLAAWQATGRLAARWMAHGALAAAYEPPYWTGTVVEHHRHRADLAVLVVRTYLPYPYLSGQHAPVETERLPDAWRPCWLATPPATDNLVELHVRANRGDGVGAALTGDTRPGDRVRLRPAEGALALADPFGSDLLLVAEDTGVAALRAVLGELRRRHDPRPVHLFWLVQPNEEPYDLAAVTAYADESTAVLPVSTVPELAGELAARGPWAQAEAYVAGTPTGVAAALTVLGYAGVPASRIRYDQIGPDD